MKSKLGISNNIVAFLLYLLAASVLFFGSTFSTYAFIILVAYVLCKEEAFLKGHALTAVVAVLAYHVIDIAFDFVPDFFRFLNFFLQFANVRIADDWGITNFLLLLIKWAFEVLIVILTISALKGKEAKLFKKHI